MILKCFRVNFCHIINGCVMTYTCGDRGKPSTLVPHPSAIKHWQATTKISERPVIEPTQCVMKFKHSICVQVCLGFHLFIWGFWVTFNTVQVIPCRIVRRAEETST